MLRISPPFRAEHIGSLKRPVELVQKRAEYAARRCSRADLRDVENAAIKSAIALQKASGVTTVTDGEFRRRIFFDGVFNQLEGMQTVENSPLYFFMPYVPSSVDLIKAGVSYICIDKLRRVKSLYGDEFLGLQKLVDPEDVKNIKLTMCSPEFCHLHHGPYTYEKGVYTDDEEYFADLVNVYRDEIKDLYAIGCRNIQIDDPYLSFFCDESMLQGMREAGIDPESRLDRYLRLLNDCIEERPMDMNIGVHLCRGNTKDGYAKGGYGRIATKLFRAVDVNCFYLEYDTVRAGGFEPLKFLPPNKLVVLGLMSTRTRELEDPKILTKQIYEAAESIARGAEEEGQLLSTSDALNRVCISPQCGFSSMSYGIYDLTDEDIREKLSLLVRVANSVWKN